MCVKQVRYCMYLDVRKVDDAVRMFNLIHYDVVYSTGTGARPYVRRQGTSRYVFIICTYIVLNRYVKGGKYEQYL